MVEFLMLRRLKSLVGQSAVYGVGSLLPKAVGFLLLPLYTNYLTPADYGIISFVATIIAVLSILLELGLGGALTRFYYDYLEKPEQLKSYYGTVWLSFSVFSLIITLLLDTWGEPVFRLIFTETPFDPFGRFALWIAFFHTAAVLPLAVFRVREQPRYYVLATFSRFLVTTLLIIYFVAFLQQGAAGSLRGQLIASALFFFPFTLISFANSSFRFNLTRIKETLAFGLPLVPHQLSGWALSVSDRILLERYVSLEQLGIYSLGYRLAMILDLILYSINMAWAPFFFRTAATEENAPEIFSRITTYYTIPLLSLSLGLSLLANDIVRIMANPAYQEAARIVPVVVLAYIAHGFYFMLVNQLFYAKKTGHLPLFTMISAGINILLNLLTLERFGIIAAAWNTVIGYAILTLLVYLEAMRVYPIPYEYRRIAIVFISAVITYFAGNLVSFAHPWLNLIIRALAVGIFPLSLLVMQFFTPRELAGIRSLPQRMRRRFVEQ